MLLQDNIERVLLMAESGYEPCARSQHVAAAVEGMLYMWGGLRRDSPRVCSGPTLTSVVDILDLQV